MTKYLLVNESDRKYFSKEELYNFTRHKRYSAILNLNPLATTKKQKLVMEIIDEI